MRTQTSLEIQILGTGTSQGVPVILCDCEVCKSEDPRDTRLRVAIAVRKGDVTIVVDVGPDFRQQMLRSKLPIIDLVLLTHEHTDHVMGLDDLRPFNFRYKRAIPLSGLDRVLDRVKNVFHYAFTKQKYPGAPSYDLMSIVHGDEWKLGDLKITAFEVMHGNLPILCYRFDDFVYITDAKAIPQKSLDLIRNCDTLVINALRYQEHWSHLTLDEALKYIEIINPRVAYLTHISHLLGKHEEVEKILPPNVFLSYDGLEINSQ